MNTTLPTSNISKNLNTIGNLLFMRTLVRTSSPVPFKRRESPTNLRPTIWTNRGTVTNVNPSLARVAPLPITSRQ